jgi:hypothetical protein
MLGRRALLVGFVTIAMGCGLAAATPRTNGVEEFVHEALGFKCLVPNEGWSLVEQEVDLELHELNGPISGHFEWASADQECKIQLFVQALTRERSPEVVAAMLEEGTSTGLTKVTGGPVTINGYPAYIAFYDHGEEKSKMVVFVSGKSAYSWLVYGTEASLTRYVPTFDRIIESFRVLAKPARGETQPRQWESSPHLPHLYRARGLGFTIKYPSGWEVDRIDETTVRVTAPDDSDMSDINAVFQTLDRQGGEAELGSALQKLRDQILAERPKAKLSEPQNLQFRQGLLTGKLFIVNYYQGWDPMFQSVGVVTDREGHLYLLSLAGPKNSVEMNAEILNIMMASILPADR